MSPKSANSKKFKKNTKHNSSSSNEEDEQQPSFHDNRLFVGLAPNGEKKKYLKLPASWLVLMTLRIVLNLYSQRSYIHPDEFFQGLEIISGDLFNCSDRIYRPWEFNFKLNNSTGEILQEPIRNIAIPYVFYGVPLAILKTLASVGIVKDFTALRPNDDDVERENMITIQTHTLIYYPRIFMSFFTIIIDFCLLKIAELCDLDIASILVTFASSYIAIVYLTRTFSNSIETIFFTLLICFILKSIKSQYVLNDKFLVATDSSASSSSDKKSTNKIKNIIGSNNSEITDTLIKNQLNSATNEPSATTGIKRLRLFDIYKFNDMGNLIGVVVCMGVFNRPTFIIYSAVPVAYWLLYGLENCNYLSQAFMFIWRRFLSLIRFALPVAFLLVLFDTIYFYQVDSIKKFQTIILKERRFIITPYNFFVYNSNSNNLKEHGEHPFYQHLINCFLLFGINQLILLLIAVQFTIQLVVNIKQSSSNSEDDASSSTTPKNKLELIKSKVVNLKLVKILVQIYKQFINNTFCFFLFSYLVPLFVFSLVSHKEPRFLLPLLVPMCLMTSHSLFGVRSHTVLRVIWIVFNFVCIVIYGYGHQGGMVPSLAYVQRAYTHFSNIDMDQHVIYYHTYMPPRHLVMAPFTFNIVNNKRYVYEQKKRLIEQEFDNNNLFHDGKHAEYEKMTKNRNVVIDNLKKIDSKVYHPPDRQIYDLMSSGTVRQLEKLIAEIHNKYFDKYNKITKNYAIFLVLPSMMDIDLRRTDFNEECYIDLNPTFKYQTVATFKFHITFDDLKRHIEFVNCDFESFKRDRNLNEKELKEYDCYVKTCKQMSLYQRISFSFSLSLYQVVLGGRIYA